MTDCSSRLVVELLVRALADEHRNDLGQKLGLGFIAAAGEVQRRVAVLHVRMA